MSNEDTLYIQSIEAFTLDEAVPSPTLDRTKTRLLVTADWHIRIKPDIPIDWQVNRYRGWFNCLLITCTQQDASLVLAGDILDRNRPSLQELDLVMEFLSKASKHLKQTYLISGNHENLGQGSSTYDYLQTFLSKLDNVQYNSSNEIFVPLENNVDLYMVGHPALATHYPNEARDSKTSILVSHFRPTVNQFIQEEINVADLIAPYDLVIAGDIHMPLELFDGKLIYTNHPLNSCFEANPDCGYVIVEANGAGFKVERQGFIGRNLIQIKTTAADYEEPEVIEGNEDYYRIEVTGSPEELRKITTDKWYIKLLKVPDVVSEYVAEDGVTEIKNVSLEQSLQDYMKSMNMDEETIGKMMEVYKEVE